MMKATHLPWLSTLATACALLGCAETPASLATSSDELQEGLQASRQHPVLSASHRAGKGGKKARRPLNVQLGPRPFYLLDDMDDGRLKEKLSSCSEQNFEPSAFSIGHRGAAMQFPEHTKESYEAAARTGAGIIECDVTFTSDRELVCRHSQCDLHTTTNILATPLAEKCTQPFVPADPTLGKPASATCCTSDITLEEFKTLCGKMDGANPAATTPEEYMNGTANWRTDLYSTCGTLLTHAESIELIDDLGAKFTPELKTPSVDMPYQGDYTQQEYASQMIEEYVNASVSPARVFAQSFDLGDVLHWIEEHPKFGKQAVYLDGRYESPDFDFRDPATWTPTMAELEAAGVNIIAPPIPVLLDLDSRQNIVPSVYAKAAKKAGLDLITWTLERDGPLANGGGFYHMSITPAIDNDGDTFKVLDVLAQQVKVKGVFSDWPATVTYYANCMKL